MNSVICRFLNSSIGRKWIVALTGLVLVGFVFFHMAGNLQVFLGINVFNKYAALIHTSDELLWLARIFLLICVLAHIYFSIMLTLENRRARPEKYAAGDLTQAPASLASRLMAVSGLVVLAFLVFHILHFTTHTIDPEYATLFDKHGRHDVYNMVIEGFSHKGISAVYILGTGLLCLHLSHGFASLFQTLGLMSKNNEVLIQRLCLALAILLWIGFAAVPIGVLANLIKPV
ncbi:MAG: succinate dehydrogenase cytochrome b subunit [Verrucomicrobiae bacterium]|nr:succinate dehydrogenase cytochrome b subunit [Verrucomicrobiae bacterium]